MLIGIALIPAHLCLAACILISAMKLSAGESKVWIACGRYIEYTKVIIVCVGVTEG